MKNFGLILDRDGWRNYGRREEVRGRGIGCNLVHAAIDDHSRHAYAEIHGDERADTSAEFLERAISFCRSVGIRVERSPTTPSTPSSSATAA